MSLGVLVAKGLNLPLLEKSGTQSTFVVATFQGYSLTSKVFDNNLNPAWNELFEFPVGMMGITSDDDVYIEVFTYRTDARGKMVGKGIADGSVLLITPNITREIKLKDNFGAENGATVIVKLDYTAPPPMDIVLKDRTAKRIDQSSLSDVEDIYQLRFNVHECRKLTQSPCDPVVVLTIGRDTRSTQICKNSTDPVFEESIAFVTYSAPFDIAKDVVHLQVLNTLRVDDASLVGEFKFVMMTAFHSAPIGWDEPAYLETDTCRTMIKKWVMLTHPVEWPKNIKGFVSLSLSVLASGQALLLVSKIDSLLLDVMANIMRPSEINAQYQKLVVRLHRCEDLCPMSEPKASVEGEENLLSKSAFSDPYISLSYSGDEARTSLYYAEYNPVFMEDVFYNLEIPTICDTLILKIMDRDIAYDGIDDAIGTIFLKLGDISYRSQDDLGFDPMFGPSYLNFYGKPREILECYKTMDAMNEGWMPGIAFRGRMFLEIFTQPSYSVGLFHDIKPSPADAKSKVEKFLNRRKFILLVGFIEASMVETNDSSISFEVSVGEFGNSMSESAEPTNSTTPSSQPLFDAEKYYFCNWDAGRPVCLIPMQWEDCTYRLETLNLLERIHDKLEANLLTLDEEIQYEIDEKDIKATMKRILKELAADAKQDLPKLPPIHNNLDAKMRDLRHFRLKGISDDALKEIQNIKPDRKFYHVICLFKARLVTASLEPQTQIPDMLIWMIKNGERIAYFKAPIHWYLFSKTGMGKNCDKMRNIAMRYLGLKGDKTACLLKCFCWFGTEEEYWNYDLPSDGRITVYAETYENHMVMGSTWSVKGMSRPEFSDISGIYSIPQTAFIPPPQWEWGEEWQISLDFSSIVTADFGLTRYTDQVFETQVIEPGKSWSAANLCWCNEIMEETTPRDENKVPPGWELVKDWGVDQDQPGDEDGWQYAVEMESPEFASSGKSYHYCRRRMWARNRIKVGETIIPNMQKVINESGGWDYAKTFTSKFHNGEMNSDIVRRRRWRRMVNTRNVGPVTFEIYNQDKLALIPPVLLIEFPEVNTYEVRAHIYQGRDLYSPEVDGFVNSYCMVSVWRWTQITRVINRQLSPTWDQTCIFGGIVINGNHNDVKSSLPAVTITLMHKGANADVQIGTCQAFPKDYFGESYRISKMKWLPVYIMGHHQGDILATFEIFMTGAGEDIPFSPPIHPSGNGYQVPPGIRPILKLTRIEVLSWGLRHLMFWSGKPIDNPNVEIECGGSILMLPKITEVLTNPNFPRTAHYFDVSLPQGNTYKPPINIRLLDQRPNGFTPLVGKYVLIDFQQFDPDLILAKLSTKKVVVEEDKDSDKNSLISEDETSQAASEAETLIIIEDEAEPTGCAACLSKKNRLGKDMGGGTPMVIVDESDDWEFLSMYWWSRYYAMQGDELLFKCFLHHELPVVVVYEGEIEDSFNNFSDSIQQFMLQRCAKMGGDPDEEDDEKDPNIGMYKGSFRIYELTTDGSKQRDLIYGTVPTVGPIDINVRVYALQGLRLACPSRIKDKTCDPYLQMKLGTKEISDLDSLVRENRDARFSKVYNLSTTIPNEPQLIVQVWDWKATKEGRDLLIGETRIDLENRYLSVKRPMCGLTERFMIDGPHKWRDFMTPVQILEEWCLANGIEVPDYSSDGKRATVNDDMFCTDEFEKHLTNFDDPKVWGEYKERIALYILLELGLVRDYVEKRLLTNPVMPGVPQGRILMWVDIFPFSEKPPEPMNVDPPLPVNQELRIIIFNVTSVETIEEVPDPDPTKDKLNDLLVKGIFAGDKEAQVTEIHTRAVNGNAAFNWRFIFNFQYAYLKRKVMIKASIEDIFLEPIVTIMVMDGDPSVSPEPYGYVHLNLAYMPRGMSNESWAIMDMIPEYEEPPKGADEVFNPDAELEQRPPKLTYLNLYKKKKTQGWWPLYKKEGKYLVKSGNVRMEMEVMSKPQAEKRPAGLGRGEPNSNPTIGPPVRVTTEFTGLEAKIATLKFVWKSPNKGKFVLLIILQVVGLVVTAVLFNGPGAVLTGVMG